MPYYPPNSGGGTGDMLASTYDPNTVADDAFDMDNMAQGTTNKYVTATDITHLSNLSGTNTGDQDLSSYATKTGSETLTNKDLTSGTNTFPTFNQNTTGSAATLTTSRTIGTLTGDVTSAGSTFNGSANNTNATTVTKINGTSLAGLATGILKNTTTTGVPSIAVAADFPTLNQNTTGSAAKLTTARTLRTDLASTSTASFDGSANATPGVTGTLALGNGGTGATTAAGAAANLAVEVGKLLFPVGSYYINETDSTNPATLLGFGTWSAVSDKFIVGHGSTYTSTGGAATHTHGLTAAFADVSFTGTSALQRRVTDSFSYNISATTSGTSATSGTSTTKTGLSGSTDSGSTIPPYQAAYIWRRAS